MPSSTPTLDVGTLRASARLATVVLGCTQLAITCYFHMLLRLKFIAQNSRYFIDSYQPLFIAKTSLEQIGKFQATSFHVNYTHIQVAPSNILLREIFV